MLLAGIVAMQVEMLSSAPSTGRSLERVTALQSLNQQLRASVAMLGDDQRIERLAAEMGMVMPGPTRCDFLGAHGGVNVGRALGSVHAPTRTTFLAALPLGDRRPRRPPARGATAAHARAECRHRRPSPPATRRWRQRARLDAGVGAPARQPPARPPRAPRPRLRPRHRLPIPAWPSTGSGSGRGPRAPASPAPSTPAAPATPTPNGAAGVPIGRLDGGPMAVDLDRRIGWIFLGLPGPAERRAACARSTSASCRRGTLQQAAVSQQVTQRRAARAARARSPTATASISRSRESADDVIADDYLIKHPLATAQKLAPLLGKPVLTVLALLTKRNGFVHLAQLLPADRGDPRS